ncbi:TonB-dependent receptor [Polaribacter batillariae]|uniref:TonB-dependent receptor n=1 Tax=Polaribacter batillariae TaxID=2808900 RepID=A0ABX7SY82_9FLAO|nr:TonB-dependent receptor [Polaribacter batillariae]QTD38453.1 TonB-dependent receptor [Polaribacter batillariae]
MKTFIFLLCTSVFSFTSVNSFSQEKVKIDADKVMTVDQVFLLIQGQTKFRFLYPQDLFLGAPKVHLKKGIVKISKLLKESLSGSNVYYQLTDKNTIVIKKYDANQANNSLQDIPISGIVTDKDGEPLPGASILEKGTLNGVQSDFDGKFKLEVSNQNAILVVSYIGYKTQEVSVANKRNLTIKLLEDTASLDEIVVVGYGTQKRESVTGSVATVKSDQLVKVPAANTTAVLAGRLPGLIVNQTSGRPGSDTANINIRGFSEGALLIVDGFQRNFTQLDPNEIETITILKDAAAAVYGVRGGGGVILVTTKRGKIGKPVISYNNTYSLTSNTNYPELANYQEYKALVQNSRTGPGDYYFPDGNVQPLAGFITPERLEALENGTDPGTNWWDVVTRKATPLQQHNLNIRGGSKEVRYFASLGFLDQGTIWRSGDFGYKRYNSSINLDANINDNLSADLTVGWRRENRESQNSATPGDFFSALYAHPAFPSSLPDGRIPNVSIQNPYSPQAATIKDLSGFRTNLLEVLNANIGLKYKIPNIEGLEVEGKMAILKSHRRIKNVAKAYDVWYYDGTDFTSRSDRLNNALQDRYDEFERLTSQISLRYNKQLGDHNLGALVLFERQQEFSEFFNSSNADLLSAASPYLNNANPSDFAGGGSASELGRNGLVGRLNYGFKGKYLIEGVFRIDKSSLFPKASRTGYFPAVSLGWVASKESFLENSNTISNLKLRASYSRLGNDIGAGYDYIEGFNITGGYQIAGNFQQGIRTLAFPNPLLTWQESDLYNVGLELGLFNNKLNFETDVFYRKRFNILSQDLDNQVLPQNVGVDPPARNLNIRDNRGFETRISYRNTFKELKLNVSANASWAREKFVRQISQQEFDDPDRTRIAKRDGEWVNRTFGYVFDGFFKDQQEIDSYNGVIDFDGGDPDMNSNVIPGDIRVKDINGDGLIDDRDRVVIGRGGTPEIIFGLNTQLEWKGFDFTMFWQGAANFEQSITLDERSTITTTGGPRTPFKYLVGRVWTPETSDTASFPVDNQSALNYADANIDIYRIDSKYVRLKNLVIGYSLPKDAIKSLGATNLRLYLSGTNLLTFDKLGFYPFDPESGDRTSYPVQKVYTLGFNVSF